MTPNIALIIQNAMRARMAPPDPAAQMVAPQPNVPRETSAPDPLESQLMALLQQKQSNPVQLYQPPMPRSSNERDVGGRGFLSGLVGGFNSRQAQKGANKESTITNLLRLQEQKRYHDMQNENTDQSRRLQEQRISLLEKQQEWARQNGDTRTEGYIQNIIDAIRHRGVTEAQTDSGQAETKRYHGILAGAAATREKRVAAGGGAKGGVGTKDISSPVSQYFDAIGARMKAALPDDDSYPKKRDAIDAWVAKQQETARMNEVARRTNQPKGEAAPSVQDDPAGLF